MKKIKFKLISARGDIKQIIEEMKKECPELDKIIEERLGKDNLFKILSDVCINNGF
ncbi:MAG: hypothetical protein ACTSR2_01345 [Candidatus Hodarchaeales archaeon]